MIIIKKYKKRTQLIKSNVTRSWILNHSSSIYFCRTCNLVYDIDKPIECCSMKHRITGRYQIKMLFVMRYNNLIDESKRLIKFEYRGVQLLGGKIKCNVDNVKEKSTNTTK